MRGPRPEGFRLVAPTASLLLFLFLSLAACTGGEAPGETASPTLQPSAEISAARADDGYSEEIRVFPPRPEDATAAASMPVPTLPPAPSWAHFGQRPLAVGVQVFEADVETDAIERIAATGAGLARTRALWKLIEATPGRYDWSVTDWLFGDTTAAGLQNLAAVYANPPWAAETECGPVSEEHLEAYAALWTALVERYDGDGVDDAPNGARVRAWQVSNEADFAPSAADGEGDYGGCFGDDPAAYARHYQIAREAARAADPRAMVGFGPVAWDRFAERDEPPLWRGPSGPYVYHFTRDAMRALLAEGHTPPTFVALHHYPDQAHFWDAHDLQGRRELVARVAAFRKLELWPVHHSLEHAMTVLVSETGQGAWPSDEWTERSEELQALYAARTIVRAAAAEIPALVWYTARDDLLGDCEPPHWDWTAFGLMRSTARDQALAERCPELAAEERAAPSLDGISSTPANPNTTLARPALTTLAATLSTLQGFRYLRPALPDRPELEAYLFRSPDDRDLLALWTSTGQRLGARSSPPITTTLQLDATSLSPWTGQIELIDHEGASRILGTPGGKSISLELGQAPVFLRPYRSAKVPALPQDRP